MKKIIYTIAFVSLFSAVSSAQTNDAAAKSEQPGNNQMVNPDGTTSAAIAPSPAIAEPVSADRVTSDRATSDHATIMPAKVEPAKAEPKRRLNAQEKAAADANAKDNKQVKKIDPAKAEPSTTEKK